PDPAGGTIKLAPGAVERRVGFSLFVAGWSPSGAKNRISGQNSKKPQRMGRSGLPHPYHNDVITAEQAKVSVASR
ncbi:MAG: hypothetical protein KJN63_06040, partial [Acidimicrobiia bacterium]|nr:hypothetical protein [Acidimicrobiia bacterium]